MSLCFQQNTIHEIYKVYKSYLEEINDASINSIKDLIDEAKTCQYKPVVDIIGHVINKFYNVDRKQSLQKVFNDWKNSKESICAFLNNEDASKEVINQAKSDESSIENFIEGLDPLYDEGLSVLSGNVVISFENFELISKSLKQGVKLFHDIEDKYKHILKNIAEDDDIYKRIVPLVLSTTKIFETEFKNAGQELSNIAEDFAETVEKLSVSFEW